MKFPSPIPVTQIASMIGAELIGNTEGVATGINEIHKVEPGDLAFVDHPKYYRKCIESAATFIIINTVTDFPEGKALLVVSQPFEAYLTIVKHFRPFEALTTPVSDNLQKGRGTVIYPGAVIGHHVRIGEDCIIHPGRSEIHMILPFFR